VLLPDKSGIGEFSWRNQFRWLINKSNYLI
jgi:hypothetical protein